MQILFIQAPFWNYVKVLDILTELWKIIDLMIFLDFLMTLTFLEEWNDVRVNENEILWVDNYTSRRSVFSMVEIFGLNVKVFSFLKYVKYFDLKVWKELINTVLIWCLIKIEFIMITNKI